MIAVKNRWQASFYHLLFSLVLSVCAAILVFQVWYPGHFAKISGGLQMFAALVAIDFVMGPLLTLIVFSKIKSKKEILFDVSIVIFLQMGALVYGVWSLASARPAYLVYEYGQYSVVREMDLEGAFAKKIPAELTRGIFSAPRYVALRPFSDSKEQYQYTMDALSGIPLAFRTELWRSYQESQSSVLSEAKLVASAPNLLEILIEKEIYHDGDVLYYLPLQGVKGFWSVVLNGDAEIIDFVEWDPLGG